MIDIKVPTVGESISEVTLLRWVRNNGDYVERDEVIAELESEKATFEVNAEQAGTLKQSAQEGDTLKIGDVLASIDETAAKPQGASAPSSTGTPETKSEAGSPSAAEGLPQAQQKSEIKHVAVSQPSDFRPQTSDFRLLPTLLHPLFHMLPLLLCGYLFR
jgi:2-oxoglutarate dehydrogenase E2 component (dihydrolipoamide succinyltransferase)